MEVLAGEPARELARLAEDLDARYLVVGTRSTARSRVTDFFTGSIAVQLSHHQHRPGLVAPTAPVAFGDRAPWE